jgi:dUTP pyrophosphatase
MRFHLSALAQANGVLPLRQPKAGDAGYDIRSNEKLELHPGEQCTICTGLHLEIPTGMVGILKDRSSMAQAGLRVSGGVIDSSYRGEIKVVLENRGHAPYMININDRIVQMVIVACYTEPVQQILELESLTESVRGHAGFGSTGVQ